MADDADLGAAARVAGGGLDLDDAVVNLGHFLREQLLHEVGVGARQEDLRAAGFAADRHDQRADAVADADHFARDLLVAADDALGAAEVDDDVAELDALDDAGDDFVGAVLEFLNWRSRSASRTFWKMTCLAAWAAMRPNSIGGSGSTMKSPTAASFLQLLRALRGRPA